MTLTSVSAEEKSFNIGKSKVSLHIPKGWQHAFNFMKTPLTLFGPIENGRRPVISIDHTNPLGLSLDKNKFQSNQNTYKSERLKWLKKNKGKVVRFTSYRISNWKNLQNVHSIGYSYTVKDVLFLEKAYYFICNEELFNVSTLITWDQNKSLGKEFKKVLSSLNCIEK
jgi:hypothetical protein